MIHQLIYTSTATGDPEADLPQILTCAHRNNPELALTGLLVIAGDIFVQLLEGEAEFLDPLVALLRTDRRHRDFRILARRDRRMRSFPGWTMAHMELNAPRQRDLIDLLARLDADPLSPARDKLIGLMTALPHRQQVA